MKNKKYLVSGSLAIILLLNGLCRAEEPDLEQTKALAEKGDAQAEYELGKSYVKKQDFKQGAELLTKAAEQGNAAAQNDLGRLYILGDGVLKSAETANQWFVKAAENGDELAMYNLAQSLELGRGVPTNDMPKAISYYRRAVEKDMPEAENRLGEILFLGQGPNGERNPAEGAKLFRKAADHGLASAQNNLAICYETGQGAPMNMAEAIKWYTLAAEGGNARAEFKLGIMYRGRTEASEQNLAKAYFWLTISWEHGWNPALQWRNELVNLGRMKPEDMTEAKRLIKEYHDKHPSKEQP
jgi:TPR repeat protein